MLFLDALHRHALDRSDRPALTWLDQGERPRMTWTYAELARRVAGAAAAIRAVASPGDRVLLVAPEGPEQALGLLGAVLAQVVAVPLHLPDGPRASDARAKVAAVAGDTSPVAVLTTAAAAADATSPLQGGPYAGLPVVDLSDLPVGDGVFEVPSLEDGDLAWLQYTSGSTGHPKGVRVCHGPLVRNLAGFDHGFAHDPDGCVLTWLPGVHDLGLVYGLILPLWKGMHAVRMAPADFVRRPARWLKALHTWQATHTASPDFGFALAAARTPADDLRGLDLSRVRVLLNGAEPIRSTSESAFLDAFEGVGIRPAAIRHAYGMSEAVAVMSKEDVGTSRTFRAVDPDALVQGRLAAPAGDRVQEVAGNGTAIPGLTIAAVDPDTQERLGPDRVGELWLHGDTLGRGYWGRPEASAETFEARTADGRGPWMRTGDLGAVGPDGVVYVTGRAKDVLIVRGANHHAEDLEHTLESAHPALRPGASAAIPWAPHGLEGVGIVAEVRPDDLDGDDVVESIRDAIADAHGVAPVMVALVPPRSVPKTSSGKRQRRETARRVRDGELTVLFQWDAPAPSEPAPEPAADLASFLRSHVARTLSIPADAVVEDLPLRDLGLDSLALMELAEALSQRLGRSIPPSDLFAHPTVGDLVRAYAPTSGRSDDPDEDNVLAALRAELDALD